MNTQQINLYQPALHPKKGWRSLQNLLVGWGVVGLTCSLWLANQNHQMTALRADTAKAEQAVQLLKLANAQQSNAKELASQSDAEMAVARQKRMDLENTIARLSAETAALEALVQKPLVLGASRDVIDFTTIMDGLARQHVAGLWLTEFDIQDSGVTLHGSAKSAALLPQFAQQLGTEIAFKGHRFDQLSLAPSKLENSSVLNFSISSSLKLGSEPRTLTVNSQNMANVANAVTRNGQ